MDMTNPFPLITRHIRLIALVTVLATGLAYAGSFLFSPSYSATSTVLVRAREARFLTSSGQDLSKQPGVIDSSLAKSLGETNAGLVTSRDVAERVVTALGLDKPRPRDESILGQIRTGMKKVYTVVKAIVAHGFYTEPSSRFEAAVIDVQGSLKSAPVKDSYLLQIAASADDPALAAAIADGAADALVAANKERFDRDATAYRNFMKEQVDRARGDVDAADQAIREYKEANGISIVSEQLKLSAGSQESVRQALHQTNVDLDGAVAKKSSLERSLSEVSPTNRTTTTVEAGRSATTTTAVSPSQLYQDLSRDLSETKALIASLEAQRDRLEASLETQPTSSSVLPGQEAKLNELSLSLSTKQATYQAIQAQYDEAVLNSAQGADEVSQVDHASAPLYPDRPVRWMFALLGLVLGATAGAGLAALLERRRRDAVEPPPAVPAPAPASRPAVAETALLSRAHDPDPLR